MLHLDVESSSKDTMMEDKIPEPDMMQELFQQPSNKNLMSMVAGILLILAGAIALLLWISAIVAIDASTIGSMIDISQLQELDPTITPEKVKDLLVLCGTAFSILAIFPILGGILPSRAGGNPAAQGRKFERLREMSQGKALSIKLRLKFWSPDTTLDSCGVGDRIYFKDAVHTFQIKREHWFSIRHGLHATHYRSPPAKRDYRPVLLVG